jgi:hypothetical protein
MKTIGIIIGTLLLIFALATCSAANDVATTAADTAAITADAATDTAATTTTAANTAPVTETLAQLSAPHAVAAVTNTATDTAAGVVHHPERRHDRREGEGVSVDGSTATITAGGAYTLRGVLADGQIIVDTQDEAAVTLTLDGVELHSSSQRADSLCATPSRS